MMPTFLGIGAQRAGTTWLHEILKAHPEIQVPNEGKDPFKKELHFFDGGILQHDLNWYQKCFIPPPGEPPKPARGEITPSYSMLDHGIVAEIQKLIPDLHVILIIRNPVERIWSSLLMELTQWGEKQLLELPGSDSLIPITELPDFVLRTDYERTIRIWSRVFGRKALHIVKFEDLFRMPHKIIKGILDHIGVKSSWEPPKGLIAQKIWAAPLWKCPETLTYHLARRWITRVKSLNRYLEGRVEGWISEMQNHIAAAPKYWVYKSRTAVLRSFFPASWRKVALILLSQRIKRRLRYLRNLNTTA